MGNADTFITTDQTVIQKLTVDVGAGQTYTYSGAIGIDASPTPIVGPNDGNIAVAKTGPGTQVLKGANTYVGATTVAGGTLLVNGSLSGTAAVVVTNGTLQLGVANPINDAATVTMSGGAIQTGGFGETLGAFTLAGTAAIDLGNGASIFRLADSSAETWTGVLSITNWSGSVTGGGTDQLFFGNAANGLTPQQLALISFIDPAGAAPGAYRVTLLASGELVAAIPEPASVLSLLVGIGSLFSLWRIRQKPAPVLLEKTNPEAVRTNRAHRIQDSVQVPA